MTEAIKREVPVRFYVPNPQELPEQSPLHYLQFTKIEWTEKTENENSAAHFSVSDDVYFSVREQLRKTPNAAVYNFSFLDATELGYFPLVPENLRSHFLASGQLSIKAQLSSFAQQKEEETTILYGRVPPHFYEALTSLSLGSINGMPFKGKLIVIVPPEDADLLKAIQGNVQIIKTTEQDKIALLETLYPAAKDMKLNTEKKSFSNLEQQVLRNQLNELEPVLPIKDLMPLSDEERAQKFDEHRVQQVQQALSLNPWVMIEGTTGIGKTHFLQEILPQYEQVVFSLEEWFAAKKDAKNCILVVDEANFMSQLSGKGENFLERFVGLRADPPSFLYKGERHYLRKNDKVIFALNPASYGAGRSMEGFLTEHSLPTPFTRFPDYYVRARMVKPLLEKMLPEYVDDLPFIANPLINVYQWILAKDKNGSLMTPRELKMMTHLAASFIKKHAIKETTSFSIVANEVAYTIGRQTLLNSPQLLQEFDKHFKPTQSILNRTKLPSSYLEHQREAYCAIQNILTAREFLLEQYSAGNHCSTDLGLGGILLEGGSGIGKTYFLKKIIKEYEKQTGKTVYRISATTPYSEKESILRLAFQEGALVIAEEFNTSLWPNKLLNSFLMGTDENNKPANNPGFMMLASQNHLRFLAELKKILQYKDVIKLSLDWPVYKDLSLVSPKFAHGKNGFFASSSVDIQLDSVNLMALSKIENPN